MSFNETNPATSRDRVSDRVTDDRRAGIRTFIAGLLGLCLSVFCARSAGAQIHPTVVYPVATTYALASFHAMPDLQCRLYPSGTAPSKGITVFTDDDGYARFHAVRATTRNSVTQLTLDCKDAAEKPQAYAVSLTADSTFARHPLNLANERGTDRPALTGNPLNYTQAQLISAGYGFKPDPVRDRAGYSRWLAAASRPGRLLSAKRPDMHPHTVTSFADPWWVGSVLTGAPNYVATEAVFNVPTGIPGGDGTTTTAIAIWNGLGGFGTGSGLIQGGVDVQTTPTVAAYGTWREYCCGDPDSNGYGGAFTPNPGEQIFSEEWYCDANGNVNINGGYGCTYLYNLNTGAVLSCVSATGSPWWSVRASPGMTFGRAAEFIIEDQSPQVGPSTAFTAFVPGVSIDGSATTASDAVETISSDPSVDLLTDFTHTTTHIVVTLGPTDQTNFNIEPSAPSYPLYCQGPLRTSSAPTPLTAFTWSNHGAGAGAPGPGQCAWADRGPRGIEIKTGYGNVIAGYLNGAANLRAGQYAEIGVYRDPYAGNDLVVTQIVGFVRPPFSSNPSLP